MNWLTQLLPPKINNNNHQKSSVPEGLWQKCISCREILYYTDLEQNLNVCPKCEYHHLLSSRQWLDLLLEKENRIEIANNLTSVDFLKFKDSKQYSERIKTASEETKESDALVANQGTLNQHNVVIAAFEFKFIGGSMGSVVGEKFVQAVKHAADNNIPFICITASGGARMQEGLTSLMQMAKTCAALTLLNKKKLPFISILANPTMGGVSASFAFLGDIVISEPNALIGFAGPRVIEQTVREKLPAGFQRAQFLLKKGAIDIIVSRNKLKQTLANILSLLMNKEINQT